MPHKYLRGLQYVTSTNGRDLSIFMKVCYEFWGYCMNGTTPLLFVSNATNTNPIAVTTTLPHGLQTGQQVGVYGVQGNTAANGGWTVVVTGATTFQLSGATGNAAYTTGGTVTVPGGMPISPQNYPQGFMEGSSTLVVGNDAVTSAIGGNVTIVSQQFNISMVGKYIVMWQPGASTTIASGSSGSTLPQSVISVNNAASFPNSGIIYVASSTGTQQVAYTSISGNQFLGCSGGTGTMSANGFVTSQGLSSDDSIYRIVGFSSSNQIQVTPYNGGTPDISTLKPNLTSRSALNYRVIDPVAASQLGVAAGNYFVGTLLGQPNINPGQAQGQFQILLRGSSPIFGQFGVAASPNGSWNGTTFVSAGGSSATMTERDTATTNSFNTGTAGVPGFITLIADTDFFLGHVKSSNVCGNCTSVSGWSFMVTTPLRLYTQAQDPNPIAVLLNANLLTAANTTDSYSNSIGMVGFDGTTRSQQVMTRNLVGDTFNNGVTATAANNYTVGPNLSATLMAQTRTGQFLFGDGMLACTTTSGQYYTSRCKLRPVSFTSSALGQFQIVGNSGEFIHMGNGVLWPWDSSILPYPLLPLGA
jgi:hypothetical protein